MKRELEFELETSQEYKLYNIYKVKRKGLQVGVLWLEAPYNEVELLTMQVKGELNHESRI